jgi:hypothetical protein
MYETKTASLPVSSSSYTLWGGQSRLTNIQVGSVANLLPTKLNVSCEGWTGHVSTSWKVSPQEASTSARSTSYDGSSHVLYWADACSEIAFVVPSTVKTSEPPSEQSSFNASCKLKVASFHSSLPCCSLVRKKLVGDQR